MSRTCRHISEAAHPNRHDLTEASIPQRLPTHAAPAAPKSGVDSGFHAVRRDHRRYATIDETLKAARSRVDITEVPSDGSTAPPVLTLSSKLQCL